MRSPCPYCGIDAGTGPWAHASKDLCIKALKDQLFAAREKPWWLGAREGIRFLCCELAKNHHPRYRLIWNGAKWVWQYKYGNGPEDYELVDPNAPSTVPPLSVPPPASSATPPK